MARPLTHTLSPLGWHLRQALMRRGMSHASFAKRVGVHDSKIHNVIYHHQRIDTALAKRFEAVLGISATTWLRLQEEGQ